MNHIVYNDKGAFRYSDFVGYLPDFLKQEPDVVTIMQVMSDYINNAYRNMEAVDEFEIKLCGRNNNERRLKDALYYLHELMRIAADRGERVMYISVPRNNVRSNGIVGSAAGGHFITIDYHGSESDEIEMATRVGISQYTVDGQVVYLKYGSGKIRPYYYDRETNTLRAEPQGTSQDPFTHTYNEPDTVIDFLVSDIGDMHKRYGGMVDNNKYIEYFFTLKVTDVTRIPSIGRVSLDSDRETPDVVVDYMNTARVGDDVYHSSVRMHAGSFAWHGDYPYGVFYFRETSVANLTSLTDRNTVMLSDPLANPKLLTYKVNRVDISNNTVEAYIEGPVDKFDDGDIYLINRNTNAILGHYRISDSTAMDARADDGETHVTLLPTRGEVNASAFGDFENVVLGWVPLYFSKGVYDYSAGEPLVRWNGNIVYPGTSVSNYDTRIQMNATRVTANDVAIELELNGNTSGKTIYTNDISGIRIGDRICQVNPDAEEYTGIEPKTWNDYKPLWSMECAVISDISEMNPAEFRESVGDDWTGPIYQYAVTFELPSAFSGYNWRTKPYIFRGRKIVGGYGYLATDGITWTGYTEADYEEGDYVIVRNAHHLSDVWLSRVASVSDGTVILDRKVTLDDRWEDPQSLVTVPTHCYLERVVVDKERSIYEFEYVKQRSDMTYMAACHRIVGDVFSPKYLLATYPNGDECLYTMITDVQEYVAGHVDEGAFVADGSDIYKCISDEVILDGVTPLKDVDGMLLDISAHYSVGYKRMYNAFMPYGGYVTPLGYDNNILYEGSMKEKIVPMYIKQVEEHSLKYGWEAREVLHYGTMSEIQKRSRSGYAEFYSSGTSEYDIVTSNLNDYIDGYAGYEVDSSTGKVTRAIITHGIDSVMKVNVDSFLMATNEDSGHWLVTVHSTAHGLVSGAEVCITGVISDSDIFIDDDFNQDRAIVTVIDADTFQYTVVKDTDEGTVARGSKSHATITYTRDYTYDVKTINVTATEIDLEIGRGAAAFKDGEVFRLSGLRAYDTERGVVVSIPDGLYAAYRGDFDDYADLTHVHMRNDGRIATDGLYTCFVGSRLYGYIKEDDLVAYRDKIYQVKPGPWPEVDPNTLYVPFTMFAKQNLFDIDRTNETMAKGPEMEIRSIVPLDANHARVTLKTPLKHFKQSEKHHINGKTEVRIYNCTPSYYNGYHTISEIQGNGGTVFDITMPKVESMKPAEPMLNKTMVLRESLWYRYTVDGVDWDKRSNQATYVTKNTIAGYHKGVADAAEDTSLYYVTTAFPHGFSAGDRIVYDLYSNQVGNIYGDTREQDLMILSGVVNGIISDTCYTVSELPTGVSVKTTSVFRGIIVNDPRDNLGALDGEYGMYLNSIGSYYVFRAGMVVVALAQHNPVERCAYMVTERGSWVPIHEKRVAKISNISVEKYKNDDFDPSETGTNGKYVYRTYNDVEMAECEDDIVYHAPRGLVHKFMFDAPHVDNLDTVGFVPAEYDASRDYSSVALRTGMDSSFKGVPDMKYPLVEKIERLAYLRDANVIDFDLIEYLGRYMGYDLTALGDDISESIVYRTVEESRRAMRETLAHLSQNYTLGGTKAGLHALLALFGIVGTIITKFTNTANPYKELISSEDVAAVTQHETLTDTRTGTWVPTPHIDIELEVDGNFPNIIMGAEEVNRLRDQIRTWKPINVVFDDLIFKLNADNEVRARITTAGGLLTHTDSVLAAYMTYDDASDGRSVYIPSEGDWNWGGHNSEYAGAYDPEIRYMSDGFDNCSV